MSGRAAQVGGEAVLPTPDEVRRLRLAVELAPAGIGHLDSAGRFVTVDRALTRLTGWDQGNLLGRTWETLISAGDRISNPRVEKVIEFQSPRTLIRNVSR